jgi:hypothetical protein
VSSGEDTPGGPGSLRDQGVVALASWLGLPEVAVARRGNLALALAGAVRTA